MILYIIGGLICLPIIALKLLVKLRTRWCTSKVTLVGKTVIVTGANTGIGYETALNLSMRGAKVILACRNMQAAEEARDKIINLTNNPNVVAKYIDLSSLETVRAFAEEIKASEEKLDILVNNAGAAGFLNTRTKDGLELTMQINYFGPFLLTILLTDLLKKSTPSRIINVSSLAAMHFTLEIDKLNDYEIFKAYKLSKLCNIYFTKEIAERLAPFNVTSFSLHPGVVKTEVFRRLKGFLGAIFAPFYTLCFKTAEEGAQTVIYTAVEKNIERFTGEHFAECQVVAPYSSATNVKLQKELWDKTEELVKLKPSERLVMT